MSSPRPCRSPAWILLAVFLCGCPQDQNGPSIPVLFDDAEVGAIYLSDLTQTPQSLELLLDGAAGDPRSWSYVEARTADGRAFTVRDLANLEAVGVYALVDAEGTPQVGLFPAPSPSAKSARMLLLDPVQVHVRTVIPPLAPPSGPVEASVLAVRVGGGAPVTLTEALLASVTPLEGAPVEDAGGGGAEGRGEGGLGEVRRMYHLADLVAAVSADVEAVSAVRITGTGEGESITLDGDTLRSREEPLPVLKRNRRGEWVFLLRSADLARTRTLRGVATLELTLGG